MQKTVKSFLIVASFAAAFLAAVIGLNFVTSNEAWGSPDSDKIVILSTNDIHASISGTVDSKTGEPTTLGYDKIAGYRTKLQAEYANVLLVDAGDYLQGGISGIMSNGVVPAGVIEKTEYDVIAVGNHEFDYTAQTLIDLMTKPFTSPKFPDITLSGSFPVVCSNLYNTETNTRVFNPYKIITKNAGQANEVQIAFVGVTTPSSLTTSRPSNFMDAAGKTIYGFCGDTTGQALYNNVQESINAARAEMTSAKKYVVLLSHLGQGGSEQRWRSDTLVKNITGADFVIDAHSHEKYLETDSVTDKGGKVVPIIQAGYQGEAIGKTVINLSAGTIASELITADSVEMKAVEPDAELRSYIEKAEAAIEERCSEKVGITDYNLLSITKGTGVLEGKRLGRTHETNLGDFICDAIRTFCKTDIAINNGGGMRADIKAGIITYKTILNVLPFYNYLTISELSGQDILDALEMGVRNYPEENGGFLQVSGLTYQFRDDIASNVEVDSAGNFVKVNGDYRVHHVMVNGEPLQLDKKYTVSGADFLMNDGGDGYSMLKNGTILAKEIIIDCDVFYEYLHNTLGGVVPARYANGLGEGRIAADNNRQDETDVPQTGDRAPWDGFAIIGGLAACAASVAAVRRRAA